MLIYSVHHTIKSSVSIQLQAKIHYFLFITFVNNNGLAFLKQFSCNLQTYSFFYSYNSLCIPVPSLKPFIYYCLTFLLCCIHYAYTVHNIIKCSVSIQLQAKIPYFICITFVNINGLAFFKQFSYSLHTYSFFIHKSLHFCTHP